LNTTITIYFEHIEIKIVSKHADLLQLLYETNRQFLEPIRSVSRTITIVVSMHTPVEHSDKQLLVYNSLEIGGKIFYYRSRADVFDLSIPSNFVHVEVEEFMKMILSRYLVDDGMLLFHGAALTKTDCGYIFVGPSGAGKSTISSLFDGHLIQDDTFCLKMTDSGYVLSTVPFRRDYHNRSRGVSKVKFFRIFQSKSNFVKEIKDSIQLLYLLTSIWSFDELSLDGFSQNPIIVNLCKDLLASSKLDELHFTKSPDFNKILE